jgi:hypothetical protein
MRFIPAAPHQGSPEKRSRIRAKFIEDTVTRKMAQRWGFAHPAAAHDDRRAPPPIERDALL